MAIFNFTWRAPKLRYYGDVIYSFYWKSAVEHDGGVKMRDSLPSVRYSPVCNVLHQWKPRSSLLIKSVPKKHFKNEQRSRDAAAKKRANTSGVGKI